jgi:hypothetical protein
MAEVKKIEHTSQDVKGLELLYTVDGNIKWYKHPYS